MKCSTTEVVRYESRGNTAVICSTAEDINVINQKGIPEKINITVFMPNEVLRERKGLGKIKVIEYEGDISVQGYLGDFCLTARVNGKEFKSNYDVIVDLKNNGEGNNKLDPPGYIRSRYDKNIMVVLSEWVGVFEKKKYFNYIKELCARNSSISAGCTRCLSVCGADAITLDKDGSYVEINPYLCQGCGDCSGVCPTGAISFEAFDRVYLLQKIKNGLRKKRILLFSEAEFDDDMVLPGYIQKINVNPIGVIGLDILFSSFAYGAKELLIHKYKGLIKQSIENLSSHMEVTNEVMSILGFKKKVRWITDNEIKTYKTANEDQFYSAAQYDAVKDKRQSLSMALSYLIKTAPVKKGRMVLTRNSPFGIIKIDADKCTMCSACVSLCPTNALEANHLRPEITIIEDDCVQCAVCEIGCPEQAIRLIPSIKAGAMDLHEKIVLVSDEICLCNECGKPFASKKMLDSIVDKISRHPYFSNRSRNLLFLCDECRVKHNVENIDTKRN